MADAFGVRGVGRFALGQRRSIALPGLFALVSACSAPAPRADAPPAPAAATEPATPRATGTPAASAVPATDLASEPLTESAGEAPARAGSFRVSESGLGIEDLVVGQGAEATVGRTLVVHYVGTLPSGARFDSSRERGLPFELELGAGRLLQGWEEGLVGMRQGGLRRLVVPPHLGYGARGQPPAIPPDTLLEFEIELLEVR
jgi:FKBP-type peptidyl-prolyl cis-trans isomerase